MKKTLIAASALLCVSQGWALSPTTAVDVELFLAGATAEKNLIPHILGGAVGFTRYGFAYPATTALCQAGTLDIYYDSKPSPKQGYDYRAYSCTLTTDTNLLGADYAELAGKKVLVHYRMKNGSWYGTGPVARSQPVTRMKIDSNCINGVPAGTSAVAPTAIAAFPIVTGTSPAAYNKATYVCPTESSSSVINTAQLVTNSVPDLGIADNEPAIFIGENAPNDGSATANGNPAYDAAISDEDLANVSTTPVFAFPLAIAATRKLVDALGVAQGKTAGTAGVAITDAQRPSLTFPQITAVLTSNGGPYNKNWSGVLTGDNNPVNICRRISAVATQITANAFFGNYPCAATGTAPAKPGDSIAGKFRIIENDLIPDERACLQGFNNGTTFTRGYTATGSAITESVTAADGNYAIGPLFIDNNPSSESFSWDFVKIDGIDPTVANVVNSTYRYINTAVINVNINSDAADPTTLKGQLAGLLIANLKKPAVLAVQNGFLAIAESGYTPGANGNNIMKASNGGKTCTPMNILQ